MPFSISYFLNWLENSYIADQIKQSLWLYPALEIIHITGIIILVGAAFMFDLRLLGYSKALSVSGLSRHLLPWSRRGLWLIVPSGILLFSTNAKTLGNDQTFWLKMSLLVVAGINILIFHNFIYPSFRDDSTGQALISPAAKISALLSILLWIAIITCGRLLAY